MSRRKVNETHNDLENEIVIYLLYRSRSGPVRRVGQSKKLRRRIAEYNKEGEYKYFTFRRCDVDELNEKECRAYHRYKDTLDGQNHPPVPNGSCPIRGCEYYEDY